MPISAQSMGLLCLISVFLLVLSFLLTTAETAFLSLNSKPSQPSKNSTAEQDGDMKYLLSRPQKVLNSLLIANNLVRVVLIVLADILLNYWFLGSPLQLMLELFFIVKVFFLSFFLAFFTEILPVLYGQSDSFKRTKETIFLMLFCAHIFGKLGNWIQHYNRRIENKWNKFSQSHHKTELLQSIEEGNIITNEREKNILKGILRFRRTTVKQIMKTRLDIHALSYSIDFAELMREVGALHYSRLPVYKENLDDIVGMVHTKDLLPYIHSSPPANWHSLMRQPFFVHEQKQIEDLLKEFQLKRIHFAIVVDEFGGTCGIVTLEDIMEEVIGDIADEFDEEAVEYKKENDITYIFPGKTPIVDVCMHMEIATDSFDAIKGESDSLGGLVLELTKEIPQPMQEITYENFCFTVLEVQKNKINTVKITKLPNPITTA